MIEAHHATQGKSADSPGPAEYQGCTDAREKRRACHDDQCKCRSTCRLWVERDAPGYATQVMTWRDHWLCFDLPCRYHQPVGAP